MRFFTTHIAFFFFFLPGAFAQMTENAIKTNFIINMAKFIEWEAEDTIDRFAIGILGADDIYQEFQFWARSTLLKDKHFDVVQFKRINEIDDVQVLYVDNKRNHAAERILDIATTEKILMFSDSCLDRSAIMINLMDLDMPGSQFEINKSNMARAGFEVPPKFLYHGGSEEDLRAMYQDSEEALSRVQEELAQRGVALKKQQAALEARQREVQALNDEITTQEARLRSMAREAAAQQDALDQKIALLEVQKQQINAQQADIDKQNDQLQRQKQEITAGTAFLEQQKLEIADQQKKIENQQQAIQEQTQTLDRQTSEIEAQTLRIEKQQTILYFFIAFFAVFAAMIFFILRAYQIKRQTNRKLREKNAAINRQKEEIQSQQEQLRSTNRTIEKQNENIKSSINYALTIQQALLPSKEEMGKCFESFVIYRPRDIVSGDFYWMASVDSERGSAEKTFVAVADCTGHGVPGAFLSMIGIKLLNSIVKERKQYDPKVILETLDREIREALKQEKKGSDDGMDICLCRMEKGADNKSAIVYSGARRPLYYTSEQKIAVLPGDRKTIGGRFYKSQVFTNQELFLAPGDRLYLTSDGIIDQNAPNRRKFGSKKLIKLLEDSLHLPMHEQKSLLEKTLNAFQQNEKQRDDISLMAIKL